jgi:hypothetical protein
MNIKNIHPIETTSRTKPLGEALFNNHILGLTLHPFTVRYDSRTGH